MRFIETEKIESQGEGNYFEDRGTIAGNSVWVIDGATSMADRNYFSSTSDAAWIAGRTNDLLAIYCNDTKSTLTGIMKKVTRLLKEEADGIIDTESHPKSELPSYAIAIARLAGDQLEYLVLGDCCIITGNIDEVMVKTDTNFRDMAISSSESKQEVLKKLKARRNLMNSPEGYWAGSFSEEAFDHAACGTITIKENDRLCITSDGLMRIINQFKKYSEKDLLSESLENVLLTLRNLEKAEVSTEVRHLKRSDDVCAFKCIIIDESK